MGKIIKTAVPKDNQVHFYWWPELPVLDGWRQDMGNSFQYNSNALAPVGSDFGNADAVMTATAVYKPRVPRETTLELFIASDRERFAAMPEHPAIAEAEPLTTADGLKLRSFTFFPGKVEGNWERVCYGEEGDFYLVFTLSARSRAGYDKALPDFEKLVRGYVRGADDA